MIALEQNRNVNILNIKDKSARAGCGENPEESAKNRYLAEEAHSQNNGSEVWQARRLPAPVSFLG